jgi:siroheme synthase
MYAGALAVIRYFPAGKVNMSELNDEIISSNITNPAIIIIGSVVKKALVNG